MWRLETTTGCYAVKQFANDMDMSDGPTRARLNATEATAWEFARRGIPALASLPVDGEHLQVLDDVGYLVFPWTTSKARKRNAIDQHHADIVADILARMHQADIHVPGLGEPVSWPVTAERLEELLAVAQQRNVREAMHIQERLGDILDVIERQPEAQVVLSAWQVVSHGDLDHKNVLWSDEGEPLIIDWESARPINPVYEVLMEALDWSGVTAHFDHRPFEHFLSVYTEAGGVIPAGMIPAAFDAILGAWINWMLFNVGRAAGIEDLRQRAIGTGQIDIAVSALLHLDRDIPVLKEIAGRYANDHLVEASRV